MFGGFGFAHGAQASEGFLDLFFDFGVVVFDFFGFFGAFVLFVFLAFFVFALFVFALFGCVVVGFC